MTNEELATRIKAGEKQYVEQLWGQVQRLIFLMVVKRLPRGQSITEFDDLIQSGFLGMMAAVKYFDPENDLKFTSYLDLCIKTACNEAMNRRSEKQAADPLHRALSLSLPLKPGEEDSGTLIDTVEDREGKYIYDDLLEELAQSQDVKAILAEVDKLGERERKVFYERHIEEISLKQIGERHGFRASYARNVLDSAYRKIRNTKTVRIMNEERKLDQSTNFYLNQGLNGFRSSWTSSTEAVAMQREQLRELQASYWRE